MAVLSIDETFDIQGTTNDIALPGSGDVITSLNTSLGGTSWQSSVLQVAKATGVMSGLSNTIDLALTDSAGAPLNGVDSGIDDLQGNNILLYTDTNNNNVVLGKVGTTVMFALYLDGTGSATDKGATGADLWMVELQPIKHLDATNPNDVVSIHDAIYLTVTNPINFSLEGAPSGQNLFLMFSDGTPGVDNNGDPDPDEVAIVVTSAVPGGTVNTGQGGGGTTIGSNNQMVDPPENGNPAEAMLFSFVQGANTDFTVPNLTAGEAGLEQNIDFNNFFETTSASFSLVQLQPPKGATLKISAFEAHLNPNGDADPSNDTVWDQSLYLDHQLDNDTVNIDNVTLTRSVTSHKVTTVYTVTWDEDTSTVVGTKKVGANQPVAMTSAEITALGLTVTFPGSDVQIVGAISGDNFKYETDAVHDRVIVTNVGNSDPNLNAAFDIGAFKIESGGITSSLLGPIDIYDDGPSASGTAVTATVDEDGATLATGLAGGPGDHPTADSVATGSIAGIFSAGRDGLQTYQLNTDKSGLPTTLKSQGGTVVYDVTGNTLTAYVEVTGAGYNATDDREVFTLVLSGTNNSTYTFTLLDQLDHPGTDDPNTAGTQTSYEDDLLLQLGTILQVKDGDNDVATAAKEKLEITVDDDSPVINTSDANDNLSFSNSAKTGNGTFSYSIGTDDRVGTTYSSTNSDLVMPLSSFTGTVGSTAITNKSLSWASESSTQVTFNFGFDYNSNPADPNAITHDTGTIVFNKSAGTYVVTLANSISSFSVLSLNTALGFTGYVEGSNTVDSSQPDVSVAQLATHFFVQFRADEEPSGNGDDAPGKNYNIDAVAPGTGWSSSVQPAGDDAFVAGEIFQSSNTWPSVSNSTAGIASDTIQYGEVLDFNFYDGDPKGFTSPPAGVHQTTSGTIFLEFDGLDNGEDLVVLLKLVDKNNPATTTTRAVIVQYGDIYHAAQAASIPSSFGFTGTIDNNDGLVVIESNDYNINAGDNWTIYGAQVIASTEGISGSGVNLNGAIGVGSPSTLQDFSNVKDSGGSNGGTWDGDVFKIVNIGFVTEVTPNAQLNFGVAVHDYDLDLTAAHTLQVDILA